MSEIDDNILGKLSESIEYIRDICKDYSKEYERVKKEYGLDDKLGFNIFSAISDKYHYENLHSDILARILDPNAEETGNCKFLEYFLEFIECKEGTFKDLKKVVCEREENRIDIFMHDDEKAIIIENKINNAVDQPNQLARYVEATENDLDIQCLVYLTLNSITDKNFKYDGLYKNYDDIVNTKIKYISAINNPKIDKNKKDLVHEFLPKCIDYIYNDLNQKENIDFYVFLKHYRRLLMHLGGEEMMKDKKLKLVTDIYEKKENILAMQVLKDLLDDKKTGLIPIRNKCIAEKIKGSNPEFIDFDQVDNVICKRLDNCYIAYYYGFDKGYEDGCFAFILLEKSKKGNKKLKEELKKIIDSKDFKKDYYDDSIFSDESLWVYRYFKFPKTLTIEERKALIEETLKLMEQKVKVLK